MEFWKDIKPLYLQNVFICKYDSVLLTVWYEVARVSHYYVDMRAN